MHTCLLVFDLTLRNRGTNFLRAQLSGWRKRRNKTLIFIVVKERSKYSVILFLFSFFHLRILLLLVFLIYLGFFQTILHFLCQRPTFTISVYFRLTYRLTKSQHECYSGMLYADISLLGQICKHCSHALKVLCSFQ